VQVFNKKQIPWLLLFLVQLGFLVFGLETKHIYTADSAEYLHQAENIFREGSTYCGDPTIEPREPPLYSRRPPGYGTFILLSSFFLTIPYLTLVLSMSALGIQFIHRLPDTPFHSPRDKTNGTLPRRSTLRTLAVYLRRTLHE
jgi:hypothetical protein